MSDDVWIRLAGAASGCAFASMAVEWSMRPQPAFRSRPWAAWVVHFASVLACFVTVFGMTGRPVFAAVVPVLLFGLLVAVNNAKVRALQEPFVFSDFGLFSQALRYPRLYLPFLGIGKAAGGAVATLAAGYWGLSREASALPDLGAAGLGWTVLLGGLVATTLLWIGIRKLPSPTFDPLEDVARLGLLASCWLYRMAERAPLTGVPSSPYKPLPRRHRCDGGADRVDDRPHLIVVQSESFFDARRLDKDSIRADVLASFDRLTQESRTGRLSVPAWGANTMRTEFSFLTGIPAETLGVHRFNPYRRCARTSVDSLAWHARALGYRTVAIHPHPAAFFGRDRVYPHLGFDEFIDIDGFSAPETFGPYVADAEVTRKIKQVVSASSEPLFVFAITMENHGPLHLESVSEGEMDALFRRSDQPAAMTDLAVYLRHLRNADRMLAELPAFLSTLGRSGTLCLFGDHVPSMPDVYRALDHKDPRTDYLIWRSDRPQREVRDATVEELGALLLEWSGMALPPSPRQLGSGS